VSISRRKLLQVLPAAAAVSLQAQDTPATSLTGPAPAQQAGGDWRLPSDDEIRGLIAARNGPRPGQGIVIGILGPEGERIVAGGTGAGAGFDSTTLFEIGSITKVFTALLLADMANKGEVSLDDPAAKYLPAGHRMPERGGRPITLTDLATHRSGLPSMADDMWPISHPDGQFADYTEDRLLAFLDRHQLAREPGAQFEYSNLGMGLVGYLLTRVAKSDYETLVRTRITGPLRMKDTMIALPPSHAARLAAPFDTYMRPVKPMEMAALAGAGAIRSTVADMLVFSKAVLDPTSPIAPALKTALSVRTPSENRFEQALGWLVRPLPGRELLMHNGQMAGFSSVLILEPAKGRAVVALVNSAAEPGPEDLAFNIVGGQTVLPTPTVPPAPAPFVPRTEISLPVAELDKVAGRYDFGPGFVLAITRDGGYLYAQREGMPGALRLQIVPEAPLAFFWKRIDAQIRFTTDASGMVTGAVVTQGRQTVGRRLAPE
jgi:CubicO group peptidase (beta-lactamase class C family)